MVFVELGCILKPCTYCMLLISLCGSSVGTMLLESVAHVYILFSLDNRSLAVAVIYGHLNFTTANDICASICKYASIRD
jgi:hypothetical protein